MVVVNVVDIVILLLMLAGASTGYRLGLAARAVSWTGGLIGLVIGVLLMPVVLGAWTGGDATLRLLVGVGTVLITTSLFSGLGEVIGLRLRRHVARSSFVTVDKVAGLIAGFMSILLIVWFLLPALATTPGMIAREVRQSLVIGWVDEFSPDPPDAARALGRLVDQSGFPDVFADLRPAPITGPPPDQIPVPQEIVESATPSTFNVEAFGCGTGFEGSGFVVADGLVVTNAHVVAGANEIRLRRTDGTVVDASILHFDDQRDIAVLQSAVDREPLPLRDPEVGEGAAVIGYPGGQNTPRVAPAEVRDDRATVGRDLRGQQLVTRQVLYLASNLQQGDSGSPVIGTDGAVIGIVFAVSPDDPNVAYALHVDELRAVLDSEPERSTGSCL